SNFPTLRIAQAAALACRTGAGPLSPTGNAAVRAALSSDHPGPALVRCFRVDPGPFWHRHVRLDRRARRGFPFVGRERVHALVINALGPVLRLQAEQESDEILASAVSRLLSQLPAEDDE